MRGEELRNNHYDKVEEEIRKRAKQTKRQGKGKTEKADSKQKADNEEKIRKGQ